MRVAFYTRISTDEDHQKYSLDAQKDRLNAYCISQYDEYEVVKIYRDTSTGTNMSRPGLEEMLFDAENGRFDVLVVFRVDRLSRNVRQLAQMVEMLTEWNVVLRSSSEPFDTSNSAGKMMLQMLGVFAEFEHATIIERTKAGMERKARNGEWGGGLVPYGYKREDGMLIIDDEESAVVRRMFREYVFGKKGATKLCRELNEAGLRKRSGKKWENRGLIKILKNPVYTGVISWKGEIFEGKHEHIISKELFDKAQAILENRNLASNGKRFKNDSDFFLTGLIYCGKCGKGLVGTAAHRNGNRLKYYSCSNRTYQKGCDLPYIRADIVEVLTMKEIQTIFRNPELLDKIYNLVKTELAKRQPDKLKELRKIESDIEKTKGILNRYYDAFESGEMPVKSCSERITELENRIEQLTDEKVRIGYEIDQLQIPEVEKEKIEEYIDALEEILKEGKNEQTKHLLRILVKKIVVNDKDNIELTLRLPDGAEMNQSLNQPEKEKRSPEKVNQSAPLVRNQEHKAPRTELT